MAFLFYFSDENQIKAGQLNVMQALVDILLQHKVDSRVAKTAAGALQNICMKGDLLITILLNANDLLLSHIFELN